MIIKKIGIYSLNKANLEIFQKELKRRNYTMLKFLEKLIKDCGKGEVNCNN